MTASYPNAIKSFTTKTAGAVIDPAHTNSEQEEIVAIQTALGVGMGNVIPYLFGGRLSLVSGDPTPTADQTAKTMLYYTPYLFSRLGMKFSTGAKVIDCAEISLSLGGFVANTNYDIFLNDGAVLSSTAWSTDTARATGLVRLTPGYLTLDGSPYKAYVGTIRTTGTTGQTEDSNAKRFVWNYYNRINRLLYVTATHGAAYVTASWRQWDNATANKVEFIQGFGESGLSVAGHCVIGGAASNYFGIGFDSVAAVVTACASEAAVSVNRNCGYALSGGATLGYHYLSLMEFGVASATQTSAWMRALINN